MKSISFDPMVNLYEETRNFDNSSFNSALDYLVEKYPPKVFHKLFEPGIGTGRIAIPLAERGYQVTGIDRSQEMLKHLDSRLRTANSILPIYYRNADVTKIPFSDKSFDIVIAVHLFYFIKEWKKAVREILRTLKPEGELVLMHTGTGLEIPLLNKRYKELCAINGCQIEEIGVKSTSEVISYLAEHECITEIVQDRWRWTQNINIGKAIEYMKFRAYSFTQVATDEVHRSVIGTLTSELEKQYGTLDIEIPVPNQISFIFVSSLK